MKKWLLILLAFSFTFTTFAQTTDSKLPPIDKSPMDMIYFPIDYPVLKIKDKATEPLLARVIYSRPQRNNRPIFGELVEYNTIWRLGANEATEVEFYKEVKIGNKKVPKGRYTLYAIARPDQWTIILNKDTDTWGAFKYDEKKDVARINVPVRKAPEVVDAFSMSFSKTASGADLVIAWDTVMVNLPIVMR
jgi:hypothetical protein